MICIMPKIAHSRSGLSTIQDSLLNNSHEFLTARSEYEQFWEKYHGDEARFTSITKTPKAFI